MNQPQRSLAAVVLGYSGPDRAPVMWWTWRLVTNTLQRHGDWMPVTALQRQHEPRCNPGTLASLVRMATRLGVLEARYGQHLTPTGGRRIVAVRKPTTTPPP